MIKNTMVIVTSVHAATTLKRQQLQTLQFHSAAVEQSCQFDTVCINIIP